MTRMTSVTGRPPKTSLVEDGEQRHAALTCEGVGAGDHGPPELTGQVRLWVEVVSQSGGCNAKVRKAGVVAGFPCLLVVAWLWGLGGTPQLPVTIARCAL